MADIPDHLSIRTWLATRALSRTTVALAELPEEELATVMAEIYGPLVQADETPPDWLYLVKLEKRAIGFLGDHAAAGDRGRRQTVKERRAGVRRRRIGATALKRAIWALAVTIESHYGADFLSLMGLRGTRPKNPDLVLDLAIHIVTMLRSEDFLFPDHPVDGQPALDRFVLADQLEVAIGTFQAIVAATEKAVKCTTEVATKAATDAINKAMPAAAPAK